MLIDSQSHVAAVVPPDQDALITDFGRDLKAFVDNWAPPHFYELTDGVDNHMHMSPIH